MAAAEVRGDCTNYIMQISLASSRSRLSFLLPRVHRMNSVVLFPRRSLTDSVFYSILSW